MADRRAVVLLSGGLDSATVLAMARAEGFACTALTFFYGQRHAIEVEAARRVAQALGADRHRIVHIDLGSIGGSALTDELEVPKEGKSEGIPITYVPARNTIFLAYALALAEVEGAHDIFIGANAVDYSGYPDCRPEFIAAFETLANLATREGVEGRRIRVRAPLVEMPKKEIIRTGLALGVDYALTHSCYDPGPEGQPCGACASCRIRRDAMAACGIAERA